MTAQILDKLFERISLRATESSSSSYTKELLKAGKAKIARKVGEEAVELVVAALAENEDRVLDESADLLYHWLVLLKALDIPPQKIYARLEDRMKDG